MNLDYSGIFEVRGHLYHQAMLEQPEARACEFERLFDLAPLRGDTVLDAPAGGGYLGRRVAGRARVTPVEFTHGFSPTIPVVDMASDWDLGQFDRVVCLAALHHIPDQPAFTRRLMRHVRPGGMLHLADVRAGSPLTAFLDEFVGRFNGTGHEGRYLDTAAQWLRSLGIIRRADEVACPWHFRTVDELLVFCMRLFGLLDCPQAALREALESFVGIRTTPQGVALDWRLAYVDVEAPGLA